MARDLYITGLTLIGLVMLTVLVLDALLKLDGQRTVTDWLVENPGWWIWPAWFTIVFVFTVSLHLLRKP